MTYRLVQTLSQRAPRVPRRRFVPASTRSRLSISQPPAHEPGCPEYSSRPVRAYRVLLLLLLLLRRTHDR
eukprot:1137622-Prymnesium_polylepis.1